MTADERPGVERLRAAITQRMGLQFDSSNLNYLLEIVRQRTEKTKCADIIAYLARLTDPETGPPEYQLLAEQLTVAETYFFRNPDQFSAFCEAVIPACMQRRATQRQLRLVSAGCASGEEAYSLAITLRERFPELATWKVSLQGIDVNAAIVAKARRGRFTTWSLRGTSDELRRRWFIEDGKEFILEESIRSFVSFETRNLVDDSSDFWMPESIDVLYCCNVTMYFSMEITRAVLARFARAIRPGGFLFLGHAETLRGISNDFHLCHTHGTFYYRRRDASDRNSAALQKDVSTFPLRPAPVMPAIDSRETWMDIIQRTSDRIATLAKNHGKEPVAGSPALAAVGGALPADPSSAAPNFGLEAVMRLLHAERFDEAMQALNALPEQGRVDLDVWLLRAVILTNTGGHLEAEKTCQEILKVDELNAGAQYLMALCAEHAGRGASAVEHDQIAIYLDQQFAMPHVHLGLLAKRKGDLDAVQRELSAAMTLLVREDAARILLFGGGFTRDALVSLCRSELRAMEAQR